MAYYYVRIDGEEFHFSTIQNETQWEYGSSLSLTKYVNDFAMQNVHTTIHVLLDQRYADVNMYLFYLQNKTIAGVDRTICYYTADNMQEERDFFKNYTQPLPFVLIGIH